MSPFVHDDVAAIDGPEWLRARRVAAFERYTAADRPTSAEEIWRYSRIDDLDLDGFRPVIAPSPTSLPAGVTERVDLVGERAALAVLHDGALVEASSGGGATVAALDDVTDGQALLGSVVADDGGPFGDLHDAFVGRPVVVDVPRNTVVEQPIVVVTWIDGAGTAAFPRVVVRLGENSEATVVHFQASADVGALSFPVIELDVGPAARLRHLVVQEHGPGVWQIGHQTARVERDGSLLSAVVALGGHYARQRIDTRLVGQGADAELVAVYFGEGDQMHDFRTLQDHAAPHTTSRLLFKGAVEDRAHSVYSGMIHIRPDARRCEAYQTNRNLTLSPHAWAESVPNLEIENNDVKCSHASAVGPIEEDQAFYLASRGVPPEVAERLVVTGFFDEVLARLPVTGLRPALRDAVIEKLSRRGTA